MTYQNSILSVCPPPTTKSLNKSKDVDFTSQFEEELPATAPVFEGHLYLRTDKKQWKWRLFRFDGTSFTCLSTRKVKLPPNSHVDAPSDDQPFISSLQSSLQSTSLTSPLLATPKTKSRQHCTTSATTPLAKYYQLPKWTVDIANISAVSVLKPSNINASQKRKLAVVSSTSHKQARCFCVRTFDGNCYIMKAHKQKDLERWLFVLTKMWKFAQTMKLQLSQQPQHKQNIQQQQQQQQLNHHYQPTFNGNTQPHHHPLLPHSHHHSSFLTLSGSSRPHHQLQSRDSIHLSHKYQHPRYTPLENSNIAEHSLPMIKSQNTQQYNQQGSSVSPTAKPSSVYEKQYHHPILSVEKSECINAWRQSLYELMSVDHQLQMSTPPPIESIPDDDQISVISDMTSISHRKPVLRRRVSIASSTSKRSSRSMKIKPRDNNNPPQKLKKKRSNDVKNWIEPRKTDNLGNSGLLSSLTPPAPASPSAGTSYLPAINNYHVSYSQDFKTTTKSISSFDLDNELKCVEDNDKLPRGHHTNTWINDTANKVISARHSKYHGATHAKQINVVDNHHTANNATSSSNHLQPKQSDSINGSGRNQSSLPPPLIASSSLFSLMAKPPLHSQIHEDNSQSQDEEEISLADLQRSLKRASLQPHQTNGLKTTSSSSTSILTSDRPRYDHHHQQHLPLHSHLQPSTIAAPAIPPYYRSNAAAMSRISLVSSPDQPNGAKDVYRHQRHSRKKQTDPDQQRRRKSWVSSCDQQKVVQHRRSIPLDAIQW